jgi:tRNA pseudouridine55 synthase
MSTEHRARTTPTARERIDGVLVIDKPRGPTSHDVVAKLRRVLGSRELGHAGTLDPMATGVLVICAGEATKLSPWLTAADKAYEATIALGVETDSLDADGTATKRVDVPRSVLEALDRVRSGKVHDHIARAVEHEVARTSQVPPRVSAIKKDGVRSYERARAGGADADEPMEPRVVSVKAIKVLDGGADPGGTGGWITLTCHVSKGYYVRALGRDLAASLGTVGHLTALRRVRSGPFEVEEAMPLDTPSDELTARLITLDRAATRALPTARLTESGARDARFGRHVAPEDMTAVGDGAGPHAWLDPSGHLVAVGEKDPDGTWRVIRGFAAPAPAEKPSPSA